MVSPNKRKIYHESQKNDELHCGHFLIIGIYYQMGQYTRSQAFLLFSRFMLENLGISPHVIPDRTTKRFGFSHFDINVISDFEMHLYCHLQEAVNKRPFGPVPFVMAANL